MDIKPASQADLDSIVALHKETFKGLFSGDLSHACLIAFYQSLLENPRCVTFVVHEDHHFAGFISGCTSGDYVSLALKIRMLLEMFTQGRILEVARLLKKVLTYKRLGVTAELIAVSVIDKYRRKGFGESLVSALETYFKSQGISRYFVFTDLKHSQGLPFYLAKKFMEIKRLSLFGLEGVFLQKEIA